MSTGKSRQNRRSEPVYGAPIPVHPREGFYETTVVNIECEDGKGFPYTHLDYEAQRDRPEWDVRQYHDLVTGRMIDAGWNPTLLPGTGDVVLVPPSAEVRATQQQRGEQGADD